MELQFKKSALRCLTRVARDISTQEVTQELRLTDGMPDIGRVLCCWGQMVLRSKEWRGDMVTLTGGVMVWVLYAPEDGTEPRCIDAWIPYQLRWENVDGGREGPVRISPLLRYVDARTVAARKFMVRAGAAALAEALCPSQLQLYAPEELPEDIEVLRRTYPVRLPKEAGEKTFELDEDFTVSGVSPEKIISYVVRPEITDQRVLGNKVVFRGNANLHLIYCCTEGRIRTEDYALPFSQYAELDGQHNPDAQADIWMGVTGTELDRNETGQMRLKCGMVAQYVVDDRELIELVEDAYSPYRNVEIETEPLMLPSLLEQREESIRTEQVMAGHNGEVVDVNFLPDFPRLRRIGEQVEMELPGIFQALYYGEDGTLQSGSSRWEEKLTLPAAEGSWIDARMLPIGQIQAVPGPEGLMLNGSFQLQLQTTAENGLPMVTGLEVGEKLQPDAGRPSLILCRPGNEGLWNLAKRCGSTVDAIRSANALQEEPVGDRLLLIPVN